MRNMYFFLNRYVPASLLADANKITDNFTFLYFKKTFLTCSLCTPEGQKGQDVVNKDG